MKKELKTQKSIVIEGTLDDKSLAETYYSYFVYTKKNLLDELGVHNNIGAWAANSVSGILGAYVVKGLMGIGIGALVGGAVTIANALASASNKKELERCLSSIQHGVADAITVKVVTKKHYQDNYFVDIDVRPLIYDGLLVEGSSNINVRYIQRRLSDMGYKTSVDGHFGPGTKSSVMSFQRNTGLSVDGKIGPATWNRLLFVYPYPNILLQQGSKGTHVKTIQKRLKETKYLSGSIDGSFGPATTRSVKTYQGDSNLSVDGIVGNQTWRSLMY